MSNEVWEKHKEHRFQWGLCPWRQEDVIAALDTGQEGNCVISVTWLIKKNLSHLIRHFEDVNSFYINKILHYISVLLSLDNFNQARKRKFIKLHKGRGYIIDPIFLDISFSEYTVINVIPEY